jgi:hypothetical protein
MIKPGNISVFLTQRCDRKCEYCDIGKINNPKDMDLDLFLKYIPYIKERFKPKSINLSGGEIGLLSEEVLDVVFKELNGIRVNTNGLFVKRGYYDKYKDKISEVFYHIIDDKNVIEVEKGVYTIVLHNKNLDEVNYLYDKYKHLDPLILLYRMKNKDRKDLLLNKVKFRPVPESGCRVAKKVIDFVRGYMLDCCESYLTSPKTKISEDRIVDFLEKKTARSYYLCGSCPRHDESKREESVWISK